MVWEQLNGDAKKYFDTYRDLPWIQEHHYDALARGCMAAANLDSVGNYELSRYDKVGQTQRRTPKAIEVSKWKQEVELMNRTFGLTPFDQSRIQKTEAKPAKEKRKTRTALRKVINT